VRKRVSTLQQLIDAFRGVKQRGQACKNSCLVGVHTLTAIPLMNCEQRPERTGGAVSVKYFFLRGGVLPIRKYMVFS
jgi:hypothetical protein